MKDGTQITQPKTYTIKLITNPQKLNAQLPNGNDNHIIKTKLIHSIYLG